MINKSIKKQKNILLSLWKEIIELLRENQSSSFQPIDEKMIDLFIFSLKDLSKFLLCFEDCDETKRAKIKEMSANNMQETGLNLDEIFEAFVIGNRGEAVGV